MGLEQGSCTEENTCVHLQAHLLLHTVVATAHNVASGISRAKLLPMPMIVIRVTIVPMIANGLGSPPAHYATQFLITWEQAHPKSRVVALQNRDLKVVALQRFGDGHIGQRDFWIPMQPSKSNGAAIRPHKTEVCGGK